MQSSNPLSCSKICDFTRRFALADEVARMSAKLAQYLLESNRKDRGLGKRRKPITPTSDQHSLTDD